MKAALDFPFKNFCKLVQHSETIRKKNVWEKSNDAYSLSIRVQTTINYISIFTFVCRLQFARHLEIAERTLGGVDPEFVSDLNHINTLMELNRKLPYFMRGKWAECAGRIIDSGRRPKFSDIFKVCQGQSKACE